MISKFLEKNADLGLVVALIMILLVLFSPIPPSILDFLIIINFSFGLSILMMTFYVLKPVEFSTFPSLLLMTTLFRLALNVAATRLILTQGFAGDVISAIGAYAAQGNFVIGLVVFFILVVVQFVVVTSGAQRVSEVAARFVLDSVPGQQMSIDADLNMGLIDQAEAKLRRKNIEREANFYGAMDGASKFVKGDAIASIVILLINIIAGWTIGTTQMGLDWYDALQRFTLLTIGDGIVTQVPALVISVATGIVVTRSSQDRPLAREIIIQLTAIPKIPLIVMGGLGLLLLLPGMPTVPIVLAIILLGGGVLVLRRRSRSQLDRIASMADPVPEKLATGAIPPIKIAFGEALNSAWIDARILIHERYSAFRAERNDSLGLLLPDLVLAENTLLGSNEYEIAILGSRFGRAEVYPDRTLLIKSKDAKLAVSGIETTDPAFGLPAVWIDDSERARVIDPAVTLVDPVTMVMTHLGEILRQQAPTLLSRSQVVAMLDGVRTRQPGLVEDITPAILSISDVQQVLKNLLSEEVSIRNIDYIIEILLNVCGKTKDIAELTEMVRQNLAHAICQDLQGRHRELSVLSMAQSIEQQINDGLRKANGTHSIAIDPRLAERLLQKMIPMVEGMMRQGLAPVLLCGPFARRHLRAFLGRSMPKLAVISVNEVPSSINIKSFGIVQLDS